ncbi:PH domain-containing protein [Flavobacterium sp.]|uniref:PH domain-containing protein n=1 Tax=Flavobacterium sp. TaxID=239 RepID=UPI002639C3C3|nr:PH domain-containing protein [Flavobacterium sp.]
MDSIDDFSNKQLLANELPDFEAVELQVLHPDYLKVMLIYAAIATFIPAAAFVAAIFLVEDAPLLLPIGLPILLLYMLFVFAGVIIGFKRRGYAIREHDIVYRSGFLSIKTTIIPFNRVQHIALHEALFPRMFKLAGIQFYTAGDESNDLSIDGLPKDIALRIKDLLASKIQGQ